MNTYSYLIQASGSSTVFESASELAKSLDKELPYYEGEVPPPMRTPRGPVIRNDLGTGVMVGIALFVASKLGDDFWDRIVKPRLEPLWVKLDAILPGKRQNRRMTVTVWHEDLRVLISVCMAGTADDLRLLPFVYARALQWIQANGVQKPVHHYLIENGAVNEDPILLEHIHQATQD